MEKKAGISRKEFLIRSLQLGALSFAGLSFIAHTACNESTFVESETDGSASYYILSSRCTGCGDCLSSCKYNAISVSSKIASIATSRCIACGKCVSACHHGAISYG